MNHRIGKSGRAWPAAALFLLAAGVSGSKAADEATAAAAAGESSSEAQSGAAAAPAPPVTVKVEEKLPYIPTSNTIATRLPLALRWTPANVGVVGDLLLREQGALVLGDALRNVSGMNAQTVFGVADFYTQRGFDSLSSSLVLTDGVPELEVPFFSMHNVERVEVYKGPAGFLHGANPMAGAVNIVRRQPMGEDLLEGRAGFGAFGSYEAMVDYNAAGKDGTRAFRLNAGWARSDSHRDGLENEGWSVNPSFTWRPSDRTSLNVNLEYAEADDTPDSGVPLLNGSLPDAPREKSYQSGFDRSEQSIGRIQIDLDKKLTDRWSFRNKTYHRELEWISDGTIFPFAPFPDGFGGFLLSRGLLLLDDDQVLTGNRSEGILSARTGSVQHQVVVGLEVARQSDRFTLDFADLGFTSLDDPEDPPGGMPATVPQQAGDFRSLVVAPYVIDQVRFSEKWSGMAGLRYDDIDSEDPEIGLDRDDSDESPMAGVVFSPTRTLSFYANAGRSFSPAAPRIQDERRQPERARQVELGTRVERPEGKLQLTLAAYRMERDNIGIPDDTGITQQAGDQLSRGFELDVASEPLPGLRVFAAYAYNDSELTRFSERLVVGQDPNSGAPIFATFDRSGNTPAFAPRHLASLWISRDFAPGLTVGGGGRFVSDQFISEDNGPEIDGYVVYDASIVFRRDPWGVGVHLKNLTDREYETRGFGSTSVIPAPPAAAYASVQYRF
ncbi:MAG TPA: TonB-dependent siderophore receptor [Candidatus Polarisedimenticolia bacterium]|nr:TonB-dependent siderophore receptor [Candidatus Polarisedimenticolia bacterium]